MTVALLAVIVASGLMIVLTSRVVAGHRSVNFDRDHVGVIQVADAGVQDALHLMTHPDPAQRLAPPIATRAVPGTSATYEVVASATGPNLYEIRSSGTAGGVQRSVTALVQKPAPFRTAAFADRALVLRGGNYVDSYDNSGWAGGDGIVGSNGTIIIHGTSGAVDGAELHDFVAPNDDPARCTSYGNTVCANRTDYPAKFDISSTTALSFIDAMVASPLCASPSVFNSNALVGGQTYCFSRMQLPSTFEVTGSGAAVVYLVGEAGQPTVAIPNKARVNCPTCSGSGGDRPDASRLQIFTASTEPVRIGNHSHVAASIFAPLASCGGNLSNAGANFYGSLVCSVITNQGAWKFHYDERLADVGVGDFRVTRWSEN